MTKEFLYDLGGAVMKMVRLLGISVATFVQAAVNIAMAAGYILLGTLVLFIITPVFAAADIFTVCRGGRGK